MSHTKGLLKYGLETGADSGCRDIKIVNDRSRQAQGKQIAFTSGLHDDAEDEANARRLVAVWNACQNIPTKALEAGVVEQTMETVDYFLSSHGVLVEPDEVEGREEAKRQDTIDAEIAQKRLAELEADPDSVVRGEALEECLREKPIPAAMRAANSIRASYCIGPISAESVGRIIDKETGLPELIAAAQEIRFTPKDERSHWVLENEHVHRLIHAIAKVEGRKENP